MKQKKQPSPSVIPAIQPSYKVGVTQSIKGDIGVRFIFKSFSLKEERKVKNLAFIVGNTILPLNNKQIQLKRYRIYLGTVFYFLNNSLLYCDLFQVRWLLYVQNRIELSHQS